MRPLALAILQTDNIEWLALPSRYTALSSRESPFTAGEGSLPGTKASGREHHDTATNTQYKPCRADHGRLEQHTQSTLGASYATMSGQRANITINRLL